MNSGLKGIAEKARTSTDPVDERDQPGRLRQTRLLEYLGVPTWEILSKRPKNYSIVMGTHGRGGFERFLLGSRTEKVCAGASPWI
jgi:nucleotide-binding universal stress UspA family protein